MIRSAKALLLAVTLGCLAYAQDAAPTPKTPDGKAGAYYNFAMGRVYAELAQAYGNKPEYLTRRFSTTRKRSNSIPPRALSSKS